MLKEKRGARAVGLLAVLVGFVAVAAVASAGGAEDDLTVIKRAVSASPDAPAAQQPAVEKAPPGEKRAADRPRRGDRPRWLKMRVVEKDTSKARVTVNLPIALVHAFGHDDWPIGFHCWKDSGRRCSVRFSEVLAALESGEDLVTIDDERETVRIWLE
jgi:hypothetical protein